MRINVRYIILTVLSCKYIYVQIHRKNYRRIDKTKNAKTNVKLQINHFSLKNTFKKSKSAYYFASDKFRNMFEINYLKHRGEKKKKKERKTRKKVTKIQRKE